MRKWFIPFACFVLAACSTEPFPHPPTYLKPSDIPPLSMPSPISPRSAQFAAEIEAILTLQSQTTPKQVEEAEIQRKVMPEMVTEPVLGGAFNRQSLPHTFYLLDRVGSDNWRISDAAKQYWNTTRPFLTDARVKPLITPLYQAAYPSGHTSATGIWSETLVLLLPQYAEPLRARASEISLNRVRSGMHFPHDIAGGRWLVKRELGLLAAHPQFQKDVARARDELARAGWNTKRPH